ncbi:MAG: magnesium transporter, partial [Rhodocyclales bacterium]|nr:magnesium transporter [Rhodocyclales bacterium]
MAEADDLQQHDDLEQHLREVQHLLARHKLVENLVHRQEMPHHDLVENLVHRQHITALTEKLESLHSADVAHILEALPVDERLFVWDLVKAERDGEILLEVSDAVRESLIESMDPASLRAAAEQLDADELADLAPDLPHEVMEAVYQGLDPEEREQLRAAMSYPEDSVGALMDFEMATVREDVTLEVVLRYLRRFDELPDHTDQLFVVDRDEHLRGVLPLNRLLVSDPDLEVSEVMLTDTLTLEPSDEAETAAQAFERYDLVSAPVVDYHRKLVGRVTVAAVVDFIREETESELLSQAGLKEGEDIFASVWDSVKNRWSWLAINLVTAFVASRVIGVFEDSIEKLVALAALMPIVAGIGGNSGNQTIT